jgi:hypothetical protein
VANYCTDQRQFDLAIEFLLMAKRNDEAFQLAQVRILNCTSLPF